MSNNYIKIVNLIVYAFIYDIYLYMYIMNKYSQNIYHELGTGISSG